jgi:hypothetical protein
MQSASVSRNTSNRKGVAVMATQYRTVVEGRTVYLGPSLERTIRTWDHATHDKARTVPGGIKVQTRDAAGVMVRDGWLLHVNEHGTVYLNPNLRED